MRHRKDELKKIAPILALFLFFVGNLYAQVILTAQKNGSDVQLTWLYGSGTYDAIRSTSPTMASETSILAAGTNSTSYLDAGAAASSTALYFYVITDIANKPDLNITLPCDTPPGGPLCNFPTTNRKQDISGTVTAAFQIYVNDVWAPIIDNIFTATAIPLNLGENLITASAKSGNDWAIDQIIVTRNNGNIPPNITVSIPADGTTIYDPTPLVTINYSDSPPGFLNLATFRFYINGTDRTPPINPPIPPDEWCYQVPSEQALSAGQNFIYVSIQDNQGYSMNASSQFIISNPIITSLVPSSGTIGSSIIINGNGFDPTPANNTVTFGTKQAIVTTATTTQLTVTVPNSAQTGSVNVIVENRTSNSLIFTVLLASGFTAITSVAINDAMADETIKTPIVFTVAGTVNSLFQIRRDGTRENLGNPITSPVGLPLSFLSTQSTLSTLYFGSGPGGGSGPIWSYTPGSGLLEYIPNTRVPGESSSAIYGMGNDASGNLYILDNGKIKRINPNLTINVLNSDGLVYVRSNSALVSQNGSLLYFTDNAYIRSIPLPNGGASTIVRAFNGPTGMANRLTAEGYLVLSRRAPATKAISVYDSINNISWDLVIGLTNPPYDVDFGTDIDEPHEPYVVVAEQSRVYQIARPSIILTNELDQPIPIKRVVDFAPPNTECDGANLGNNNWITLKVKFLPATLIPTTTPQQLVTWTVEDPDDPSDDPIIDPDGPA